MEHSYEEGGASLVSGGCEKKEGKVGGGVMKAMR